MKLPSTALLLSVALTVSAARAAQAALLGHAGHFAALPGTQTASVEIAP